MFKKSIKLKPTDDVFGAPYFGKCNQVLICRDELSKLFTLPKDKTTPITLVFSEEKSPNSYTVRFLNDHDCEIFYEGGWNYTCLTGDAELYVDKVGLRGTVVWVTVYWEE